MGEIGHLNLYTSRKNYNRMKRAKKMLGAKTWEDFMLIVCELIENKKLDIVNIDKEVHDNGNGQR